MAGTGIADWPVSYDEIEPYYTQAEWEIGISGPNVKTPFIAPMSKPYPCQPLPLKSSGALMQKAAAKLDLMVTPNVAAIITEPYNGRSACINCGMCSGYGCQVKARSSSAVALLPIAVATGNCEIRVHSYVREISVDASGRATGVTYFDKRQQQSRSLPEGQVRCASPPTARKLRACCCCPSPTASRRAWPIPAASSASI